MTLYLIHKRNGDLQGGHVEMVMMLLIVVYLQSMTSLDHNHANGLQSSLSLCPWDTQILMYT